MDFSDLREFETRGFSTKNRDVDCESAVSPEQLEAWKKSHGEDLNIFKNGRLQPWLLQYLDNFPFLDLWLEGEYMMRDFLSHSVKESHNI